MPLVADGGLSVRDAWTPPDSESAAARDGSVRLERYEGRDEVEAVREGGRGVDVGEGVRRDLDMERSVIMARPTCERPSRRAQVSDAVSSDGRSDSEREKSHSPHRPRPARTPSGSA